MESSDQGPISLCNINAFSVREVIAALGPYVLTSASPNIFSSGPTSLSQKAFYHMTIFFFHFHFLATKLVRIVFCGAVRISSYGRTCFSGPHTGTFFLCFSKEIARGAVRISSYGRTCFSGPIISTSTALIRGPFSYVFPRKLRGIPLITQHEFH